MNALQINFMYKTLFNLHFPENYFTHYCIDCKNLQVFLWERFIILQFEIIISKKQKWIDFWFDEEVSYISWFLKYGGLSLYLSIIVMQAGRNDISVNIMCFVCCLVIQSMWRIGAKMHFFLDLDSDWGKCVESKYHYMTKT